MSFLVADDSDGKELKRLAISSERFKANECVHVDDRREGGHSKLVCWLGDKIERVISHLFFLLFFRENIRRCL